MVAACDGSTVGFATGALETIVYKEVHDVDARAVDHQVYGMSCLRSSRTFGVG